MMSTLLSRNVIKADGHRTSIRLEPEFWRALASICQHEDLRMSDLVKLVQASRKEGQGLTTAIRVFVLDHYIARVT